MRRLIVFWLLNGTLAAQDISVPGPQPDDKSSIEGTVVNAMTGEVLKKVHLTLRPVDHPDDAPYGTTTDSAGHFLMDQLDPGRYSLTASRDGFITESVLRRELPIITLANGQDMKELVLKLVPQGVIAGRVTDEDGDPVVGVSVQSMILRYQRGRRQFESAGAASTDDLGEFRPHHLPPGKYVIAAWWNPPRNYGRQERLVGPARSTQAGEQEYISTYYPNATDPQSAVEVEVVPGADIRGIDIVLAREVTASITGHVNVPQSKSQGYSALLTIKAPELNGLSATYLFDGRAGTLRCAACNRGRIGFAQLWVRSSAHSCLSKLATRTPREWN